MSLMPTPAPTFRDIVGLSLAHDPFFAFRGCASGVELLEVASAWRPDLALLDVMMPGMDVRRCRGACACTGAWRPLRSRSSLRGLKDGGAFARSAPARERRSRQRYSAATA